MCGGKEAAKRLRDDGCDTVGKLYAYVRGPAIECSSSSSSLAGCGDGASPKKSRSRVKKLRRLVKDDDLAIKIESLLLRLMSAFEELRVRVVLYLVVRFTCSYAGDRKTAGKSMLEQTIIALVVQPENGRGRVAQRVARKRETQYGCPGTPSPLCKLSAHLILSLAW